MYLCKPYILVSFVWAVLRIYVALTTFQSYRNLEAGETQSLKFKMQDQEWNPGSLAPQSTSLPMLK